ncbi:MAG TPA: UDP-N-acetylmuramate dehydrogenase [Actinomycetota bacterium]|jgi:UDP-N-acetylmuramate dehydrogenase|nr:UDP-N-acetylmuramate dehydrogenase [Actinomycetota bacterium]
MSDAVLRAEAMLRAACGDRVRTRFPMAPLTTFRIGGPAALYLEPESDRDLVAAGRAVTETGLPVIVVGKGSNMLVSDGGFDGLVLRLGKGFRWTARNGSLLSAGAAMPLPALAGVALRHGLGGLEFGVAIPASMGGAVTMNAGAHGHEIAEVLERVETFRLRSGVVKSLPASEAGFEYRRSALPEDAVVTAATVALVPADDITIRGAMDDAREWRRRTQPLAEPNCGSVFRNPPGGHAARLIEEAGLKGRAIGGASVSLKHANFIVAAPGASASDVVTLIRDVRELVERRTGIRLESEVHLVGEFDHAPR